MAESLQSVAQRPASGQQGPGSPEALTAENAQKFGKLKSSTSTVPTPPTRSPDSSFLP